MNKLRFYSGWVEMPLQSISVNGDKNLLWICYRIWKPILPQETEKKRTDGWQYDTRCHGRNHQRRQKKKPRPSINSGNAYALFQLNSRLICIAGYRPRLKLDSIKQSIQTKS
jgi:hypothetical protein